MTPNKWLQLIGQNNTFDGYLEVINNKPMKIINELDSSYSNIWKPIAFEKNWDLINIFGSLDHHDNSKEISNYLVLIKVNETIIQYFFTNVSIF